MHVNFCSQCGVEIRPGSRFCSGCGEEVVGPVPGDTPRGSGRFSSSRVRRVPTKSVGGAIALAIILPLFGFSGIGHLYVGRLARGILILLGSWAVDIVAVAFLIGGFFAPVLFALAFFFFLMGFVIFIWQIIDAAHLAEDWNAYAEETGGRPW